MAAERAACERDGGRLAGGRGLPGVTVRYPVQSNAVFAALNPVHIKALQADWNFSVWDPGTNVVRWMTAFNTTEGDVDAFAAAIKAVTSGQPYTTI